MEECYIKSGRLRVVDGYELDFPYQHRLCTSLNPLCRSAKAACSTTLLVLDSASTSLPSYPATYVTCFASIPSGVA